MKLKDALQKLLSQSNEVIFDWYDIEYFVFSLYKEKTFGGEKISSITKQWPNQADIVRYANQLINIGFLSRTEPRKYKSSSLYITASKPHPFELVCYNQAAYISHLSAIITHGLTDRRSNTIWVTHSAAGAYHKIRQIEHLQRMEKLTELSISELDYLLSDSWNTAAPDKIQNRRIRYFSTRGFQKEHYTKTEGYNVSTIGKTFLDMLDKPDFCGGLDHVMQIYSTYGATYSRQIIRAADQFSSKILKCRIGYLLESESGIQNNKTLNKWVAEDAQRGGSRKLDPHNNYSPHYSERWCLSINID